MEVCVVTTFISARELARLSPVQLKAANSLPGVNARRSKLRSAPASKPGVVAAAANRENQRRSVMQVDPSKLSRRLGLPAGASEAQIKAALAPTARKPAPVRRPATDVNAVRARVKASTDAGLAVAAAGVGVSEIERRAIAEEREHRSFMGRYCRAEAQALGYSVLRPDLAARQGSVVKGMTGV
jgi:hypothetical protein